MSDLSWCVEYLAKQNGEDPRAFSSSEETFRALQNVTMPFSLGDEFYERQDAVLQTILASKKVVSAGEIEPIEGKICLYQGDITLLAVDAIVNACNRRLLGCFAPGCHCVDNAIHSFAGLQVRRDLMKVMKEQGHDEPNGKCKVTKGYNLPAKYVFHTVGPIYSGSEKDAEDLKSCYESCLRKANEMGLSSLAFCSLSTGVFGYPNEEAAAIAVGAARAFLSSENRSLEKVVFCVFSERDRRAYQALLSPKESFPAE